MIQELISPVSCKALEDKDCFCSSTLSITVIDYGRRSKYLVAQVMPPANNSESYIILPYSIRNLRNKSIFVLTCYALHFAVPGNKFGERKTGDGAGVVEGSGMSIKMCRAREKMFTRDFSKPGCLRISPKR